MLKKWCESVDEGGVFSALLTDCLTHEPLIAKLHAYGFDMKSLNLIYDYLSNRNQSIKVGGIYKAWPEILQGFCRDQF